MKALALSLVLAGTAVFSTAVSAAEPCNADSAKVRALEARDLLLKLNDYKVYQEWPEATKVEPIEHGFKVSFTNDLGLSVLNTEVEMSYFKCNVRKVTMTQSEG